MRHTLLTLSVAFLVCTTVFGQDPESTDQIILKLKNETVISKKSFCQQKSLGNSKVDSVSQKFNAVKIKKQSIGKNSDQHIYVIRFPKGTNIQQAIDEYYKTGEIEYAEPDYKVSIVGPKRTSLQDYDHFRQ